MPVARCMVCLLMSVDTIGRVAKKMANYTGAVSGKFALAAALADDASISLAFPPPTDRDAWAVVDVATAQVAIGQNVYSYPDAEIAIDATLTITNKSGETWPVARCVVSAKIPEIPISRITQDNYDALFAAENNRLYLIPEE